MAPWAGCSAVPGQKPAVRIPWISAASSASQGPARWVYTPPAPRGLLGRIASPDGPELYFGRNGERWRIDRDRQVVGAAGDRAEQDLVAAARSQGGGWLFIGASGTIFEADEPLGPFRRALSAPEPVARVEASPQGLLAVTLRGTLLRSSDGGATFARAALDAPFAADVQLLEDGSGLLLAFPERLYETRDGGLGWTPLPASPIGAQRFHRFDEGSILVQGISGSFLWKKDAPLRATRELPPASAFQLPEALGPGPDASAFALGMGFWRGDQSVEALPPARRGEPWRLGVGRPGQRLEVSLLPDTEGCQRLALDGNDRSLIVACSLGQRGASLASVRLLRYGPSLEAPETHSGALEGALGEARVALGRDGRILVWGVCRVGGSRAACDGDTPLLLPRWIPTPPEGPPENEPSPWLATAIAGQNGRPVAVAFGSGGRAYLVAQRGKTRDLGLFVSQDGARSFEGRELGLAGALEEQERKRLSGLRSAALSVADDGIVAVAFEGQFGALVAVTDEDGRVLSVSSVPGSPKTRIGMAGRRLLAVDGAAAFESLDGGVSWTHLGEIPSLRCPERGPCERRVSCHRSGCLVGNQVGRLGWGGQGESGRRAGEGGSGVGMLRVAPPPVVCRLGREKWATLPKGSEMPSAFRAERGKSAWATSAFTPANGQVVSVHGPTSGAGKPEEITLLPAVKDTGRIAMAVSSEQIEGVAAVRLELAPRQDGSLPGVQRIEVAWENHFEGKISRGTIPAPKDPFPMDLDPALGQVSLVSLPMLSISNGGVFVRLSHAPQSDVFFLDHRGKVDRQPAPVLPTSDAQGEELLLRSEAIRVGNTTAFLGYHDATVARLLGQGRFEAVSLFPAAGSPFSPENQLSFSYLDGVPYLVHIGRIPQVGVSQVSVMPMRASGPLLGPRAGGPSQRLLSERFRPCAAQDRAATPRVVAPAEVGTRRGVLIEGPDGSSFASMVSEAMVLHGTSESPCGSVIEGVPARQEPQGEGQERALVFLGDLERSWFFRSGAGDTVEARAMSCKIVPGTPLPLEVQAAIDRRPLAPGLTVSGKRPLRIRR